MGPNPTIILLYIRNLTRNPLHSNRFRKNDDKVTLMMRKRRYHIYIYIYRRNPKDFLVKKIKIKFKYKKKIKTKSTGANGGGNVWNPRRDVTYNKDRQRHTGGELHACQADVLPPPSKSR